MDSIVLQAQKREKTGRKSSASIKQEGLIPAVIYGKGTENQNLTVDRKEFDIVFEKARYSSLVDINIGDAEPYKVLIKEVSFGILTNEPEHIDFYRLKMDEEVTAGVELEFVGKSKAVVEKGGTMVKKIDTLKVRCLPDKLMRKLEVDISSLEDINESIRIKNIKLPEGITCIQNPNDVVVSIARSRQSSVMEATDESATEESEEAPAEGDNGEKKEEESNNKK